MSSRSFQYTRPKVDPEETLLAYLVKKFNYLNRQQWEEHINAGHLSVNGEVVQSGGSLILQQRDMITFSPPRALEPAVDEDNIDTLFEDDDIFVCAKNGELPVEEGGRYCDNTLVGVLNRRAQAAERVDNSAGPSKRQRTESDGHPAGTQATAGAHVSSRRYCTVQRLDKETSGVLVLAKCTAVANTLRGMFEAQSTVFTEKVEHSPVVTSAQFEEHLVHDKTIQKSYVALLSGACEVGREFVVTARIGTVAEHPVLKTSTSHQKLKKLKMVCEEVPGEADSRPPSEQPKECPTSCSQRKRFGKSAATRIRILAADATVGLSLAKVDILTGRSHQIRVHCAHVGFPVLGDKLYTTTTPGTSGHAFPVDDDVYLTRVRNVDKDTGRVCFTPDALNSRWHCRRHMLHAAVLMFSHPTNHETVRFTEEPGKWFLRI